jgi:hypothetical protein
MAKTRDKETVNSGKQVERVMAIDSGDHSYRDSLLVLASG